jgi:GNAT superfamily N-acetyltransferase
MARSRAAGARRRGGTMTAEILDLPPDHPRLPEAWAVMAELRTHRSPADMDEVYAAAHALGYRVTAAMDDGACVAVAGWRIGVNLHLGRNLYVEDLVTAESVRSGGHGAALLAHLEDLARREGCAALHLDSGVQRHDAHRFYFREGMHISSHHFLKALR